MSVFSSVCHDHDDRFDVAYSFIDDEIRIAIDDDDSDLIVFLTAKEVEHLIEVLQQAVKRVFL